MRPSAGRSSIDWKAVHARLARIAKDLEQAAAPDMDEVNRILRERAAALAAPPPATTVPEGLEVVEFVLGSGTYAIETAFVRAIAPSRGLTPLPCTPDFIAGIINLHGDFVSVVDLTRLLGFQTGNGPASSGVLVLQSGAMAFAILVDSVSGLRFLPAREVVTSLPGPGSHGQRFRKGVTHAGTVVLDGAALLQDGKLIVHEEVE